MRQSAESNQLREALVPVQSQGCDASSGRFLAIRMVNLDDIRSISALLCHRGWLAVGLTRK